MQDTEGGTGNDGCGAAEGDSAPPPACFRFFFFCFLESAASCTDKKYNIERQTTFKTAVTPS